MSMFVGVRLPEELVKQMDSRTENRSAMIVAALESYLGPRTDPRPTKTESEAIVKVKEKAERVREPKKEAKSAIEVVVSSECPHGWPTKRMCNFNSGGCKPW